MGTISKILGAGIAAIQLVDIVIHAATNQLEIIRVFSNLIILAWLTVLMLNWFKKEVVANFYPVHWAVYGS